MDNIPPPRIEFCHLKTKDELGAQTKVIQTKLDIHLTDHQPLTMPIFHSSTYCLPDVDAFLKTTKGHAYSYSRIGNPTTQAAEVSINIIEGGAGTILFSSGMAAITTAILGCLNIGDHIVCCSPIYAGTHTFLSKFATRFGFSVSWVPTGCDISEYEKNIQSNTRVLYGETPANPDLSIMDMEKYGKLGQKYNVVTMIDSTFASAALLKPIEYGVDIVLHSCTKYMGGHSDLLAGSLTARSLETYKAMRRMQISLGNTLSPHDASLLHRGMKTLPLRMERHSSNALILAKYLEKHEKITKVFYPGLPSHSGYEIAKKQMKSFSGMISFNVRGGTEAGKAFVHNLKMISLAVSLGGVESLVQHPATMTHGDWCMTDDARKEARVCPGLIRLSVGLEDVKDLQADLEQALAVIP